MLEGFIAIPAVAGFGYVALAISAVLLLGGVVLRVWK